jgi:hypothetical protein
LLTSEQESGAPSVVSATEMGPEFIDRYFSENGEAAMAKT